MKLLYISTIVKNSSFGEVSRKYIKMLKKYSDWDIYFFNVNSTISEAKETYTVSDKFHATKYMPNYHTKFNNKDFSRWYLDGIFHINDYILQVNPDIVIMLYNDGNIYRYVGVLEEIRHIWKGLFIPFTPIDYENPLDYMFRVNYDACITMNQWSVNQLKSIEDINYPVFSCPHIVDGFHKLEQDVINQNKIKIYGKDFADKYIVGCVNANNGRKRLDLVIKAFIKFYENKNKDSILYIKTTKFETGGITVSFNLEKFTKNYPILVTEEYLTSNQLNILYNTFDIMINATDGEGFGLTPFEAALAGTLSILPNNSSFTSLIENDKIPDYLIPCKLYPYEYVRNVQDITLALSGKIYQSIYYDCKSYKNTNEVTKRFNNILSNVRTYIISKKLVPSGNVFSDMDQLIRAPWDSLQIQILVTSDIESLRYVLGWLTINNNIIWPGKNRYRSIISLKSLENYVGTNSPRVGLISVDDLCKKMIFYRNNKSKYQTDLKHLSNFVIENYNEKVVWECFNNIIKNIKNL